MISAASDFILPNSSFILSASCSEFGNAVIAKM